MVNITSPPPAGEPHATTTSETVTKLAPTPAMIVEWEKLVEEDRETMKLMDECLVVREDEEMTAETLNIANRGYHGLIDDMNRGISAIRAFKLQYEPTYDLTSLESFSTFYPSS